MSNMEPLNQLVFFLFVIQPVLSYEISFVSVGKWWTEQTNINIRLNYMELALWLMFCQV